jgi:hypothetical protein
VKPSAFSAGKFARATRRIHIGYPRAMARMNAGRAFSRVK